jgi:RNA polymerase sigma-70 factor (ECF subfamily)
MNDHEAVSLSKNGDHEASECLVERYGRVLQGTAYMMTKDAALAEELTQDAFLSAWKGLGGFREGHPVKPWLVRILVNRVLEYRRRRSLPTTPIDEGPEPPSADRVADEVEARDAVERSLAQLDADHPGRC